MRQRRTSPRALAGRPFGTLQDAPVERYSRERRDRLRSHLADRATACGFVRGPNTLKSLTPRACTREVGTSEPGRLTVDPIQQMPELSV